MKANLRLVFVGHDLKDEIYQGLPLNEANFLTMICHYGVKKGDKVFGPADTPYFNCDTGEIVLKLWTQEQAMKERSDALDSLLPFKMEKPN